MNFSTSHIIDIFVRNLWLSTTSRGWALQFRRGKFQVSTVVRRQQSKDKIHPNLFPPVPVSDDLSVLIDNIEWSMGSEEIRYDFSFMWLIKQDLQDGQKYYILPAVNVDKLDNALSKCIAGPS